MEIRLIKTEGDYHQAIQHLETLGDREDFQTDEKVFREFELLAKLIEFYEQEHYPVMPADPIEVIKLKMDYMGLTRKDLSGIASSGVLSEVFSRKRTLSKKMIREFSMLLKIDQNVLNPGEIKVSSVDVKLTKKRPNFDFLKSKISSVERYAGFVRENRMLFNVNPL